jgi:hypothetical protein
VKKHFGTELPVRIGPFSRDKWKHAKGGDVLVDDRPENIHDWVTKGGGHGILHTDYKSTSNHLMKITACLPFTTCQRGSYFD